MLNVIRSRANPSIMGIIMSDSQADNQPAVKITQTDENQAPVGCVFNYHSKCWSICPPDDFEAQLTALEFLISHATSTIDVVIIGHRPHLH